MTIKPAYLKASCAVRYWEDGVVNGLVDDIGVLIPCREGDNWEPVIHLGNGRIEDWPPGTNASIHYKVCDAGIYWLLDDAKNPIARVEGYVISMMSPKKNGYGDYVIMDIDAAGQIAGWRVDLEPFGENLQFAIEKA